MKRSMSKSKSAQPPPSANPLLIETIVERVLSFVPDEDLDSCFKVNKLWRREVERVEKKRHSVTLQSETAVQLTLDRIKGDPNYRISELIAEKFHLDAPIFKTLILKVQNTISALTLREARISLEGFRAIIRAVGPTLNQLELGTVKTLNDGTKLAYFPIPDLLTGENLVFPKLKCLEFISFNDVPEEATTLSATCLTFPNLQKLITFNMCIEPLEVLENVRLPQLKYLQLNLLPDDSNEYFPCPEGGLLKTHIDCLMKLQLQLKELKIHNVNGHLDVNVFKKFLESQAPTLEHLVLLQYSYGATIGHGLQGTMTAPSPFPVNLPNLQSIIVARPFVKNLNQVLNSCPKLKEVCFDFYRGCTWTSILPNRITVPETLESLSISWIDNFVFSSIAKAFKMITVLKINNVNDEILCTIFKDLPNLETLIAYDHGTTVDHDDPAENNGPFPITDQGLTGLDKNTLKRLDLNFNPCKPKKLAGGFLIQRKKPFIGFLKKLGHLHLEFSIPPPLKHFFFWGIRKLPSLHTFFVNGLLVTAQMKSFMSDEGFVCIGPHESPSCNGSLLCQDGKKTGYTFLRIESPVWTPFLQMNDIHLDFEEKEDSDSTLDSDSDSEYITLSTEICNA